jgi:hypothetical protein
VETAPVKQNAHVLSTSVRHVNQTNLVNHHRVLRWKKLRADVQVTVLARRLKRRRHTASLDEMHLANV